MLAPSKEVVLPQQHVPVPLKQIVQPAAPASSQEVVHPHPHTPAPSEGEVTDVSAQPEPVPSKNLFLNYH